MENRNTLTESELNNIVANVCKDILDEITIPQAVVGGTYNILAQNDLDNGNENVTFGSQSKSSYERLEKSNDIEWQLLSKAIMDSMGVFRLNFIQKDGGCGNKTIRFDYESLLSFGNNGFVLYGNARISGKKLYRGKFVDDIRKIKVFYNADTKQYSWINTFSINDEKYIKIIRPTTIHLPKGNGLELLENKNNEAQLFSIINQYVEGVNNNVPKHLQLKIKL